MTSHTVMTLQILMTSLTAHQTPFSADAAKHQRKGPLNQNLKIYLAISLKTTQEELNIRLYAEYECSNMPS